MNTSGMVIVNSNVEILGSFNALCRHYVGPEPRVRLVPAEVSHANACQRMKHVLFEALFVKSSDVDPLSINVRREISGYAYDLRRKRLQEEADKLELNTTVVLSGHHGLLDCTDATNIMRFLLLLSQPASEKKKHLIGFSSVYTQHPAKLVQLNSDVVALPKRDGTERLDICLQSLFVPRPMLRYADYSRDLFERSFSVLDERMQPVEDIRCAYAYTAYPRSLFETTPGGSGNGRFLFAVKGMLDDAHDKAMASTLFGALSRPSSGNVAKLRLELPELSTASGLEIPKARSAGNISGGSWSRRTAAANHSSVDEGFVSEAGWTQSSASSLYSNGDWSDEAIEPDAPEQELSPAARYLTWENRKRLYNRFEKPFLTEAKSEAFDVAYMLHWDNLLMLDPTLAQPVPRMRFASQLIHDTRNVLISLPSRSYEFDEVKNALFLKPGIFISGLSPEALQSACSDFAFAGTCHHRLSAFCSPSHAIDSTHERGLVFRAFADAVRCYLQCYRKCVVSLPITVSASSLSLLRLKYLFRRHFEQLALLLRFCQCDDESASKCRDFPTGVCLLSLLYKATVEATGQCSYTLVLSLLHAACQPYLMFINDWVFYGICRDQYEEFMIRIDDSKVACRDRRYWTEGFSLVQADTGDNFPLFLKELSNGIYVCGKSMHLLRLCCPEHFMCAEQEIPPVAFVYADEEELHDVAIKCQAYVARVRQMAKHKTFTRTSVLEQRERAKHDLILTAKTVAAREIGRLQAKIVELKRADDAKKRQNFRAMKEQMEKDLQRRATVVADEKRSDAKLMDALIDRESALSEKEKELEAQARDELIEEYAQLTEAAAQREQRALWRVRRRYLDNARMDFLLLDRQEWTKARDGSSQSMGPALSDALSRTAPANLSMIDGSTKNGDRTTAGQHNTTSNQSLQQTGDGVQSLFPEADIVPNAEAGLDVEVLPGVSSNVSPRPPNEKTLLTTQAELIPGAQMVGLEPHAAAAAGWSVSLESVPMSHMVRVEGLHSSQESKQITESRPLIAAVEGCHVSNESESVMESRPHLAAVEGLYVSLESQPGIESIPHIAASEGHHVSIESPSTIVSRPHMAAVVGHHASYESESATELRTHIAAVKGHHASVESEQAVESRPHRAPVEGHHVTAESDSVPGLRSRIAAVEGRHASVESESATEARPRIAKIEGRHASIESKPAVGTRPHIAAVEGRHISMESEETKVCMLNPFASDGPHASSESISYSRLQSANVAHGHASFETVPIAEVRPHGARVEGRHASLQCKPVQATIKPRSGLDYLSEVGRDSYMISGPSSVKSVLGQHVSIESIDSSFQIKTGRRVVQAKDAAQLPAKPQATDVTCDFAQPMLLSPGQEDTAFTRRRATANDESEFVDHQAIRVLKFRERNLKGHSSDSSIQRLMYGTQRPAYQKHPTGQSALTSDDFREETAFVTSGSEFFGAGLGRYESFRDCFGTAPTADLMAHISNRHHVGPETVDRSRETTAKVALPPMYEYSSLAILLQKSVAEPLAAQVSLVNSSLLSYFMVDLSLDRHFEALRHYLLMENGEYSQVVGDLLFEKLDSYPYAKDVLNPVFLNQVLAKSLQSSLEKNDPYAKNLTFALKSVPSTLSSNAPDVFSCLELKYRVEWPLNVVMSDGTLAKYGQVFSFMLQLRRIVYALTQMWVMLKRAAVVYGAAKSVQMRQLQLYRYEMQHFVKVMQGYVANQVIEVAWREFQDNLQRGVHSLDDLYERHATYVNHCLVRCLLNKKASAIAKVIHTMFGLILKMCGQLRSASWQRDAINGDVRHPAFQHMVESYMAFKQYSQFLFKVISKLALRGYQPQHLQELLLRLNFNDYYDH